MKKEKVKPYYDKDGITIYCGDCLEIMKQLSDNSIDTIITDPPYGISFMGKEWDKFDPTVNKKSFKKGKGTHPRGYIDINKRMFYDFSYQWAKECLRVLKPGGYLLSFGGTRTYHRMACAIEDAGFEIRDMLEWIYREGFPKSLNIAKAYDKKMGKKIENKSEFTEFSKKTNTTKHIRRYKRCKECGKLLFGQDYCKCDWRFKKRNNKFEGLGTALKPAHEPICMAMKPLSEKNFVDNVIKWGTGGVNIDACRIPTTDKPRIGNTDKSDSVGYGVKSWQKSGTTPESGRFPANILCQDDALNDGEITKSGTGKFNKNDYKQGGGVTNFSRGDYQGKGDYGSKSRYFDIDKWNEKHGLLQFPKASKKERNMGLKNITEPTQGNTHPTVKPLKLMLYLVSLVSREGQIVLDPFAGSFTTGVACILLKRRFIGIEKEKEYLAIGEARMEWAKKEITEKEKQRT